MAEETPQQIADRINIGPHQSVVMAEDESGNLLRFVVHRPTMRDQLRIGVSMGQLTSTPTTTKDGVTQIGSPVHVADLFTYLAEAIATLNTVVDMRPAGLSADVGDWTDTTLVQNLFQAYGEWLDHFRKSVPPASGAGSGTTQPAETGVAV